jgi:hypothetical protein
MAFYSTLVPDPAKPGKSLTENYDRAKLKTGFLMSKDITYSFSRPSIEGRESEGPINEIKNAKAYALFDSYLDAFDYICNVPLQQRVFYECIYGNILQKPHFDLDLEGVSVNEGDKVLAWFLYLLIEIWKEVFPTLPLIENKHILVYTSHGPSKSSYHVVVNGYACDNHEEAKEIYQLVMAKNTKFLDLDAFQYLTQAKLLNDCLDASVYSSMQNFRLLGCQKIGKGRIKVVKESFPILYNLSSLMESDKLDEKIVTHLITEIPRNRKHAALMQFSASLLTLTNNCIPLPRLVKVNKLPNIFAGTGDLDELVENNIEYLLKLVHDYLLNFPYKDPKLKEAVKQNPFTVNDRYVIKNIIPLRRLFPSYCPNCERIHEGQTSFLHLHPRLISQGTSYEICYSCGRNQTTKSVFLGLLIDPLKDPIQDPVKVENSIGPVDDTPIPVTEITKFVLVPKQQILADGSKVTFMQKVPENDLKKDLNKLKQPNVKI